MSRLPDFLVIGAMKCGTTSLHDYLSLHPEIFVTEPKEIHYFTEKKQRQFSLDWYKSHFISDRKVVGTSPQNYTKRHNKYYEGIPDRISKVIPKVKLIYIVRDPVKRLESHVYENLYNEPRCDLIYNIKSGHYIKTGMYHYQISAYIPYFPLDNIHFVVLEDLINDKLATLNQLFSFLGVSRISDDSMLDFVSNARSSKTVPYFLKHSSLYRKLRPLVPVVDDVLAENTFMRKYLRSRYLKIMLDLDKESIVSTYEEDVAKLRDLTGLTLHQWAISFD